MRNRGKLLFAVLSLMLLACTLSIISVASAEDKTYTIIETQITTSGKAFGPSIYGDKIVYQNGQSDNYPQGIYVHDLSTGRDDKITGETSPQGHPVIYEDMVAWTHSVNSYQGYTDIHMRYVSGGDIIQVTTDNKSSWPAIYGDKIVYQNGTVPYVYVYDIPTGEKTKIADSGNQPAIYGNRVTYQSNYNVFYCDISDPRTIQVSSEGRANYVAISGDKIVFENAASPAIRMYDITTGKTTAISNEGRGVVINGDRIAWEMNGNIYMYNISDSQTVQITNSGYATSPAIYGDRIVWQDQRGGAGSVDIYMATVTVATPEPNPNTPPTVAPVSVTNTESPTPIISWTYKDADNDLQQQYELEVWSGMWQTGTKMWSQSQSSMYSSVTYGGYALEKDKTYYVRVRAFDGTDWSDWSETSFISVTVKVIDTGFNPDPDGFKFVNNKPTSDEISEWQKSSWNIFREAYGPNLVDNNYFATQYYNKKYIKTIDNGRCFGFSVASLNAYRDGVETYDLTLNDDAFWKSAPLFTPRVSNCLGYYHATQFYPPVVKARSTRIGPNEVYRSIRENMSDSNPMSDPFVIDFWWWKYPYTDADGDNQYDLGEADGNRIMGISGHTVVPYRIEESADQTSAKVYVYDSNHPGSEDIYFEFDLNADTVTALRNETTGEFVAGECDNYHRINAHPIAAVKLSETEHIPTEIPSFETISPASHLLYTDASGNQLGYLNDAPVSEIPGAYDVRITGQDENDDSPETYLIPTGMELKREIIGRTDGVAILDVFKTNTLITVQDQVSAEFVDGVNISKDASNVEFISGKETLSLNLTIEKVQANVVQVVSLNTLNVETGGSIGLSNIDGTINIKNKGQSRTCSLDLEQVGVNPNSDDSIKNIIIEEDSTVFIRPSNWNDIANSQVIIEHDIGSDGSIDSTEIIRPIKAEITFDPETFNLNSNGEWVTAYIELPTGYSVSGIDIGSVLLNGTVHAVSDQKYGFVTNESEYLTDLDLDGISERMFKFNRAEVAGILKAGDQVTVTFTGKVEYNNGISSGMASFEGSDVIKVTQKDSKNDKTK